jgi:adenylosuccinate synthase
MTKHKIVVGLGFGDEGKGTVVDAMCAKDDYGFVVRFSGGPQAAHNVVLDDGTHHTFSQFGSGTFSGTRTILSRFMMINPFNMVVEADALQKKVGYDPMELLYISENSLVITDLHVRANRIREKRRGDARHGSCGQGVGEAQRMALETPHLALYAKDLINMSVEEIAARLQEINRYYVLDLGIGGLYDGIVFWDNIARPYKNLIADRPFNVISDEKISHFIKNSPCVFEGSQGTLLDEWYGFHPYTTWSTTTPENACTLLQEAGVKDSDIEIIGVTRTYQTRHGAGPFPTEHVGTFSARYLASRDVHNTWGEFQGGWRVGNLDFVLLEYSKKVVGRIDSIALTHMDQEAVWVNPVVAYGYSDPVDLSSEYKAEHDLGHQEHLTATLESLDPEKFWYSGSGGSDQIKFSIEMILGAPVLIESYGPERGKKEFYYLDGPTKRRYNKDHVGINQ